MTRLLRLAATCWAPALAAAVLALLPDPATAQARLTTLSARSASASVSSGPYHVSARATPAVPLASGRVLVWGTATPLAATHPTEPAPTTASASATSQSVPAEVALRAVYPNPLASRARVPYELPEAGRVHLAVYDALGRQVAVLADGERPAGWHTAAFDATALAPGVYLARLTTGVFVGASRFTVVR